MKRWRTRSLLLAGGAALAIALPVFGPAFGQRDKAPQSLLPPGFGEQNPPPKEKAPERPAAAAPAAGAAAAGPTPAPAGAAPAGAAPAAGGGVSAVVESDEPAVENNATQDLENQAENEAPPAIEIPDFARRPTDVVGPLTPMNWGLGQDEFGNANGIFLASLMRRLDAPLPSRWESMLLRRALLSRIQAPAGVNPVDWVAERSWLLLRMGEADAARLLVQSVDVDQFTPRMFTVAVQSALATADPAALCPLVGPGRSVSDEPIWPLADAMCAALRGDSGRASELIDQARGQSGAGGIDLELAEKVIGAGSNTRRAVAIQWDGVDSINSWRFGIASATGLKIPDNLMTGVGSQVWAWEARAPMIPLDQRVEAAQVAASLGVFSSASLVAMYSSIADTTDPSDIEGTVGGRLRRAFVGGDWKSRVGVMHDLWDEAKNPVDRHARLILTATAAARVPPSKDYGDRIPDLIASMMTAGLDQPAARWGGVVDSLGDDRAWSILAVGSARPSVDVSSGRVRDFVKHADEERGKLLVAALAGLGRLQDPGAYGVNPNPVSRWEAMIEAAARNHQAGTVALLAGVGMQTSDWRGVPPEHLYQIVSALRAVGHEYEARMIAAEAMSRL
ncbi:MAG TPA: hypothetical protein VH331_02875 [Allosphingosinicella sp.]|jgi:hypothetical protein|nr:hypothetical protein [Allosphingosinicella sp.]